MSSDKEIKFYTVVYLSFYDFIKNDKKKTTTFMNQSKKLFPGENIEKMLTGFINPEFGAARTIVEFIQK